MNLESSEDENKKAYKTSLEIENTKEIDYQFPVPKDVIPGSYVLVDFLREKRNKTHYRYVCVVILSL